MVTTLEEAKAFFRMDRYASEATGIEILEASEGYAKVELEIGDRHRNAAGMVRGAVYFTMADFAFAVASNFNRTFTCTLASQITFLAQARGSRLTAEAKLLSDGRRTCFSECRVADEFGTIVAAVTANGYRVDPKGGK